VIVEGLQLVRAGITVKAEPAAPETTHTPEPVPAAKGDGPEKAKPAAPSSKS
jgi:hypothetical protein